MPQKDWNPPEDFDPEARPVYIANENSPGADVAADVAAALASASILFKSNGKGVHYKLAMLTCKNCF